MFGRHDKIIIAEDKELREVLLYLLYNGPTPERAVVVALEKKFPSTTRARCDFINAVFRASHSLFVELSDNNVMVLTKDAEDMIKSMDLMMSSCGATSLRSLDGNRALGATYCWYCGGLM